MAINDLVHDTTFERIPSFILQDETYSDEEQEQSEIHDHIIGTLKECLEEIDMEGIERIVQEICFQRMVTKIGNKMKAQKDEEFVVTERGAGIDDELSQKHERFKVKTVNKLEGMSSIKFFVAILLIFTIAGSEMMIAEACEESWDLYPCNWEKCKQECTAKRGERARGRCTFVDTCSCTYRC
ncbi:hypothetical protein L1987_00167 [Smallanthus sonchifolius]|uniref:Uncharacterized protein n=1 Tax=Smallanthus sonchifolius TaxID=185202 RepID=A0ACB9K1H1_9ASTR|nr:hypothetical protein L1987_00167 [Smallanthus sonchifolius]